MSASVASVEKSSGATVVSSQEPDARKCVPSFAIINFLKQRERVVGNTSECERVVGCEQQLAYDGSHR